MFTKTVSPPEMKRDTNMLAVIVAELEENMIIVESQQCVKNVVCQFHVKSEAVTGYCKINQGLRVY